MLYFIFLSFSSSDNLNNDTSSLKKMEEMMARAVLNPLSTEKIEELTEETKENTDGWLNLCKKLIP